MSTPPTVTDAGQRPDPLEGVRPRQIPGGARLLELTPELLAHYGGQPEQKGAAMPTHVTEDGTEVQIITSKFALEALRADLGLREDWHEPDEQGVTVQYQDGEFDNAMALPSVEAGVWILKDGVKVAYVNLALLFAFGTNFRGV